MSNTTTLRKWGNSVGFTLPKQVLQQLRAHEGAAYTVDTDNNGSIHLKPMLTIHEEWLAAFNAVADVKSDELLIDDLPTQFDKDEWTW